MHTLGVPKILSIEDDGDLQQVFAYDGKDGIEVIEALKADENTRTIPVIVMTAYPSDESFLRSAAIAMGAVEFLAKPVRVDDLLKTIERLLPPAP